MYNLDEKGLNWIKKQENISQTLWSELKYLRERPLKKGKNEKQALTDRPVASLSKPDRLRMGMGTEITVIFRSSACSWAGSDSGGCTMCGYWNDRALSISSEDLWEQFQFSIEKYHDILANAQSKIVFKMFTSGSFCDSKEIPLEIQLKILEKLSQFSNIQEIVVESRPQYVTAALLVEYQKVLKGKYLEIAIGLESANDLVRNSIINKGFSWEQFIKAKDLLHQHGFGIKAYLLLKPPFMNEYSAIIDTYESIRECIKQGVDTISINPTNIQINTLCDELAKDNAFRPPWLFSVLWIIKHAISADQLKKTRIVCDPSAAGKERGVHNCDPSDESNEQCLEILRHFVETQDIGVIPNFQLSGCWQDYAFETLLK
jgi:hypothetical protein